MKKKKSLIASLIIIVIIIVAAVYGMYNKKQIDLLVEETNKISQISSVDDEIDMEIKTKGKYAIIEETMKNYINDVKVLSSDIVKLCNESNLDKVLDVENLKNDKPEFTATKQKLSEFRTQVNDKMNALKDYLNEEKIMGAIQDKNLNDNYVELYKTLMFDQGTLNELSNTGKEMEEALTELNTALDSLDKIVNFLSENASYWDVNNGQIQFNNAKKLTEYYDLLKSMQ